jgi:hypothetical protein
MMDGATARTSEDEGEAFVKAGVGEGIKSKC